MLTIKNIKKIEGITIVINGFQFTISTAVEYLKRYAIVLSYKGTAHAPIIVSINREGETFGVNGELKKYVMRRNDDNAQYISDDNLVTPYEFIRHITYYLNNPNQ